jgi:GntR family transcriptional regulator/MocR family aminotransferase
VLEHAVAELIEDGELQPLNKELGGVLDFELPAGGITLWARVAAEVPLDAWCERALARGVAMATARDFALDGRARPFVRLAYARYSESELAEAVRRLRDALPRGTTSTRLRA